MLVLLQMFACSLATESPLPASAAPAGFWEHWGDGKAEMSGYTVEQPRYGDARPGEAVLIVVTETFTEKARVKSDGGHKDEFPVVKLNDARDFQTGIYDYNTMTSTFVRLDGKDRLGVPTKVSFGSQEWCGHIYEQLVTTGDQLTRTSHSYFDGEADASDKETIPPRGVFLDAMPLYVRGLAGTLPPTFQIRDRLLDVRFEHRAAQWTDATLKTVGSRVLEVPAGRFETQIVEMTSKGETWRWFVETAPPHRLIQWEYPRGEVGTLTGTTRLPYWQLNGMGQESMRKDLGLKPPSWTQE